MIQSVLTLLAPACEAPEVPPGAMALSAPMTAQQVSGNPSGWKQQAKETLAVAGNALGLMLWMAGLGLVLRLAEVMLS